LAVLLSIFTLERIYNSSDEFHVPAMDASYYGILEAHLTTNDCHTNVFGGHGFREFYKLYYQHSSYFPYWDNVFFNEYVLNRYMIDEIESIEDIKLYDESVLETKILLKDKEI